MPQQQAARVFLSHSSDTKVFVDPFQDETANKYHEVVRDLCFLTDQGAAKLGALPKIQGLSDPTRRGLLQLQAHIAKLLGG